MRLDKINVYLSKWHILSSPAIIDSIISPLKNVAGVELIAYEGQNERIDKFDYSVASLFCMVMPPREILFNSKARLCWVPMVDWVWEYSQAWWASLPRSIKIIAFSEVIVRRCMLAGIKYLCVKYYKNPDNCAAVQWDSGRILYYWNRSNLYSMAFLEKICQTLNISTILIREAPIPGKTDTVFKYPNRIGETTVEKIPDFLPSDEYNKIVGRANIILAPRPIEGIGMLFIESLARGCAVFACNSPTMNEYINHCTTGYFWSTKHPFTVEPFSIKLSSLYRAMGENNIAPFLRFAVRLEMYAKSKLRYLKTKLPCPISEQNWDEIKQLNLRAIGEAARKQHVEGYKKWVEQSNQLLNYLNEK